MKVAAIGLVFLGLVSLPSNSLLAQPAKAVTVPVTLDHNRIVIDVYVPLKDGTTKRVRGLVDTGRSEVMISERVAMMVGGSLSCDGQVCHTVPPPAILIGGKKIPLSTVVSAKVFAGRGDFSDVLIPGMSPEVVISSTVLASYDLVIDYANRQFTIGEPGSVKFSGTSSKVNVHANGFATLPGKVDGRVYNFGIDTGCSVTLVDADHVAEWHKKQASWPYVEGALGAANMMGAPEELETRMLQLPAIQIEESTLRDVLVASVAKPPEEFVRVAHAPVVGLIGGEAFKGTRIGIDYAHSNLYVEQLNSVATPGLDVVGLTLRPEVDGRYTVVAIVPLEGQPAVANVQVGDVLVGVDGAPVTGATMGQVWSLLGGEPGQVRKLVVERGGRRLAVEATIRRFLAAKAN